MNGCAMNLISELGMDLKYEIKTIGSGNIRRAVIYSDSLPIFVKTCDMSESQALQKAYYELLAIILGNCWYDGCYDRDYLNNCSFRESPFENYRTIDEIVNAKYDWYSIFYDTVMKNTRNFFTYKDFLSVFLHSSSNQNNNRLLTLPFYKLDSGEKEEIPLDVILYFGKKNTVYCDSTHKSAIIKGLSKMISIRHSMEIHERCITPPDIPENVYKKFHIFDTISDYVMLQPNRRLTLKDCSLSTGFPVVAAVITDKITGAYRIAYGASPSLETAIEEAIYNLLKNDDFVENIIINEDDLGKADLKYKLEHQIMVEYHYSFFLNDKSYDYSLPNETADYEEEAYDFTLQYFLSRNYEVYIRDISLPGYYGTQVFVPKLCSYKFDFSMYIKERNTQQAVYGILMDSGHRSEDQFKKVKFFIKYKNSFGIADFMSYLIKRPIDMRKSIEKYIKLLIWLDIRTGDWVTLSERLEMLYRSGKLHENCEYYICLRIYAKLKGALLEESSIWRYLTESFEENAVDTVRKCIFDEDYAAEILGFKCNHFNCSNCENRSICQYKNVRAVSGKIYEKRAEIKKDGFENISDLVVALTNREMEVAELYANGGTRKSISDKLFISENTVKRHLSNIFVKLGISDKNELMKFWNEMKGNKSNGKQEKYF